MSDQSNGNGNGNGGTVLDILSGFPKVMKIVSQLSIVTILVGLAVLVVYQDVAIYHKKITEIDDKIDRHIEETQRQQADVLRLMEDTSRRDIQQTALLKGICDGVARLTNDPAARVGCR